MVNIKSEREIDRLRESATLVSRTLAEVAKHVDVGVPTIDLDAIAEDFIRRNGAVPAFKGYRVGAQIFPRTLCISINDAVVHGIPGPQPLEDGDIVSVDCGVLLNGYYGDSAYTFIAGTVSPKAARLCKITYDALYEGISAAVVGNRIGDISNAVQTYCEARGYGVVKDLVGHGIGRSLHEDPQVPNVGKPGSGRRLKVGMSLCLEPMINTRSADVETDEDNWTVRTRDGLPSAHYEHMVVVRNGEAEILTSFDGIEAVILAPYNQIEEVSHG